MKSKNWQSLNVKLIGLVFMGIVPLTLGIFFYVFPVFEDYLIEQRKSEVKASVDVVMGMLEQIEADVQSGKLHKDKVGEVVQKLFEKLRYNKTDYFFAYDTNGNSTAHGNKPEMVGTNFLNKTDKDGKAYVKDFVSYADKSEGGFVSYKFEKIKGGEVLDKISYVQYFAPWRWIVGSGVYVDVIQAKIAEVRAKVIIGLAVLSLIIFTICWRYSATICKKIDAISFTLFNEADQLASVALEIGKASETLSSSTTQQATALQQTSASIEETSAMINKNAENAKTSMQISERSQSSVEHGKIIVNHMISSIDEIARSNVEMSAQFEEGNKEFANIVQIINEIGEKTKVINDIVFQTKLLAFNASVEAARAGEMGKGFAVVAEEVGNLAQMSGNSAKEISDLLTRSIVTVKDTVDKSRSRVEQIVQSSDQKIRMSSETAQKCVTIFNEIVSNVKQVNNMVGEIAVASNEQASGIREINSAVAELDSTGQQNSVMSSRTHEFAEQLKGHVDVLRKNTFALDKLIKGEDKMSA